MGLNGINDARLQIPVDALEPFYDVDGIFAERVITLDLGPFLEQVRVCANTLLAIGQYDD